MKRAVSTFIFVIYAALLIRVMVFKDLPIIRLGHLMFRFGGTDGGYPPNFVPFKTISSYLFGSEGVMIGGVNLLGNIALLVPIGLLAPLVFRGIGWKKALLLALASGLTIELLQEVLRIGVFDIDDVLLNAFGVMVGYWLFLGVARIFRSRERPAKPAEA